MYNFSRDPNRKYSQVIVLVQLWPQSTDGILQCSSVIHSSPVSHTPPTFSSFSIFFNFDIENSDSTSFIAWKDLNLLSAIFQNNGLEMRLDIEEYQNYRMVGVGSNLWKSTCPMSLLKQGDLEYISLSLTGVISFCKKYFFAGVLVSRWRYWSVKSLKYIQSLNFICMKVFHTSRMAWLEDSQGNPDQNTAQLRSQRFL